jgi:hypothetical protein
MGYDDERDGRNFEQLNYPQIIMSHMTRISFLSTIFPKQFYTTMQMNVNFAPDDFAQLFKKMGADSLRLATDVFEALMWADAKDNTAYKANVKNLIDEYNSIKEGKKTDKKFETQTDADRWIAIERIKLLMILARDLKMTKLTERFEGDMT